MCEYPKGTRPFFGSGGTHPEGTQEDSVRLSVPCPPPWLAWYLKVNVPMTNDQELFFNFVRLPALKNGLIALGFWPYLEKL